MAITDTVRASMAEIEREFPRFSDVALSRPVVVTQAGRPRNVLISYREYERLIERDQRAFRAAETPDEFLEQLDRLAAADH